ncbi:class I SAM-dependent methyltransferase [Metabacillus litoralis]|uniref:class I SAM-dependent methyltransferase n=1 Tax=Metabacillus litoralis TaxID=152268 RepID=UPI00203CBD7D|nr:class I SAM-dependent methyltransferase [Metabacillus litoralis]MCM3163328.1 class I SAM-dependent methyltransferase [Metabacillus litoralis]
MKKNESSVTSLITAFSRAYHSMYDTPHIFNDYIAKNLLTQEEFIDIRENLINSIQLFNQDIAEKLKNKPDEILKWITQIQLSPTPLSRAAYCEQVLKNEIALGVQQYVILGAGFDSFCLRNQELHLEVFEVDHPATQENKKSRLANDEIPDTLHFVPGDFTKDFTIQSLVKEGFHPDHKTFFSLLGVSYYLTKQENANLISTLFSKIPQGSSIVFDYADEHLFEEKGKFNRVQNMVKMASASGEQMKSCFTYEEMEKMLEHAGLLIYEHLSPETIQQQFFSNRSDYLSAFETIHYIHAVKK